MTVFNGSATLAGSGVVNAPAVQFMQVSASFAGASAEQSYGPGSKPGDAVQFKASGYVGGVSSPPAWAAPSPAIDPTVAALKASMKSRHGLSETGGNSGPITF